MFRKSWKTIKFFLAIGIVLIVLPHSILPHQSSSVNKDVLDEYIRLNDNEPRLAEYKDDREAIVCKLMQLEVINKSRRRNNVPAVKLDIFASRVANKMSREAAYNNFMGHWNTAGEKPYQRYAFEGGHDHISENAYGGWTTGSYTKSQSVISSMMKAGHDSFMSERAPADGHKRNITEKSHNYVGIGYYLSEKQFRYYEEFIDRYIEFEDIPLDVRKGEPFSITVKTSENSFLYCLIAYYEKTPEPVTADELRKKGSYNDFTDEQYFKLFPWDLAGLRNGNIYKIPLRFDREGSYYIHIYIDNKEISSPSSMDTKGKIQASGVVIRVNESKE